MALQENHNLIEELKADLVSMFLAEGLHKHGYHTDEQLRGVYGAGILRALNETKSIREDRHDSSYYVDWSKAERVQLPNLKPSTTSISLRLPVTLLERIKIAANKRDVPYHP